MGNGDYQGLGAASGDIPVHPARSPYEGDPVYEDGPPYQGSPYEARPPHEARPPYEPRPPRGGGPYEGRAPYQGMPYEGRAPYQGARPPREARPPHEARPPYEARPPRGGGPYEGRAPYQGMPYEGRAPYQGARPPREARPPYQARPPREARPPYEGRAPREARSARKSSDRTSGRWAPWLLVAVLVVQVALSARLLGMNSAFEDEGEYLWFGHWELMHITSGAPVPSAVTWFSGAPVIYPVLGALANDVGGLVAARLLSLAFMLGATTLLYLVASRLFSRTAGLAASAVFVALGPVQRLGAFATYDAMAIFLLALASWLVVRATGKSPEIWLVAAAMALTAANATKYASALWDPMVVGLALLTAPRPGVPPAIWRAARLTLYTVGLEGALLLLGGSGYVQGLMFSTLSRKPGGVTASSVLYDSAIWIGAVVVLGVAGIVLSFSDTVRTRLLCVLLTAAALLAPLHQAQIHTLTSLSKHVAFGVWFAAAAAGYALARVARFRPRIGWLLPVAAAAAIGVVGVPQAATLFHTWPSSARMMAVIRARVRQVGCPCLASQSEVVSYYLTARPYTVTGPWYFNYWDAASHREIYGLPAYALAIRSHYFKVIELDRLENSGQFEAVTSMLAAAPGYQLAGVIQEPGPGSGTLSVQIWWYRPGQRSARRWP